MIDDWPRQLARTLESGLATASLEQHLDALLIWLGNPDNPNVAVLDEAIARTGLTRLDAAGRAYDILERLLFAGRNGSPEHILGLRDTADVAAAKQRYRCLIQAYHPDRHPARVLLHNERTEQINIAYAAFERSRGEPAARGRKTAGGPLSTPRSVRHRRRPAKRVDRSPWGAVRARWTVGPWLRHRLGAAESFQTRFFAGLIIVCVLLLASSLYPTPPPHRISATLEPAVMPVSTERIEGVERPETRADKALVPIDAQPAAIVPLAFAHKAPSVLDSAHALDNARDFSTVEVLSEVAATVRSSAGESTFPHVAMTKKVEHPSGIATTEMSPLADPAAVTSTPKPVAPKPAEPEPANLERVAPKPAPSSQVRDCDSIGGTLDRFRRAYNSGALDPLMALYRTDARENETQGRKGIRRLYLRRFDETTERRIDFSGLRIRAEGKGRCGARAGFSVRFRDSNGREIKRAGTIDVLFDGAGPDARILRIAY